MVHQRILSLGVQEQAGGNVAFAVRSFPRDFECQPAYWYPVTPSVYPTTLHFLRGISILNALYVGCVLSYR